MKKFLLLVSIGLTLFSCSKKEEGNLRISGEIKGLSQGKLYIQRLQDTILKPIKVIKFDGNSKFETYLNIKEPEVLYVYLDRGVSNSLDNNIAFFAEQGEITINSDIKSFIAKAEVTGNKNQELWNQYKKVISNYNQKNIEYIEQKLEAQIKGNTKKVDSLQSMEDRILLRKYQYSINFCMNNKDYEIAPFIALTEIYDANPVYLDSLRKVMPQSVLESKYGKIFSEYLDEIKVTQE